MRINIVSTTNTETEDYLSKSINHLLPISSTLILCVLIYHLPTYDTISPPMSNHIITDQYYPQHVCIHQRRELGYQACTNVQKIHQPFNKPKGTNSHNLVQSTDISLLEETNQVQFTNILTHMSVQRETNLVPVDHRLGLPTSFAVESHRFIPEKVNNMLISILTNFDFHIPDGGQN